jgi:hypothetical protein
MSAAHGGQIVLSGATEARMRDQPPDGMGLLDLALANIDPKLLTGPIASIDQ